MYKLLHGKCERTVFMHELLTHLRKQPSERGEQVTDTKASA